MYLHMSLLRAQQKADSLELVDFHVGQADFSGDLPNGQAWLKFFSLCLTVDY